MRAFGYILAVILIICGPVASAQTAPESTYARVMRTGTIRCGYIVWPPLLNKDPNTGNLSGLAHDVTEALGTTLNLKIDWVQEMSFATYLQDLEAGRFDMECSGGWPNALRGKIDYFTKPYGYVPLVAVVRADETRLTALADFNKPEIKIATTDGETSSMVYRARFPLATQVSLPQTTSAAEMILNVTTRKADFTLLDAISVLGYQKSNPGKVKIISFDPPLHLIALSATIPPDDRYQQMLNIATDQLINNGTVDAIIKKYEPVPGAFLRVASPAQK